MSIFDSIRSQLVPITPEGYPFIGAFALASLILFWLWTPLGWIGTVLTLWCAYFFRDPPRVTPVREGLVVAPADGRVSQITTAPPPHELGLGDKPLPRISIFMSVFDCHVNRSPVAGRIERIVYQPGKFFNADLDKASADNERNSLVIATAGARIGGGADRRAGRAAHRLLRARGPAVGAGERFGMIRFGSRLDVYLPDGTPPLVAVGQTAIAGETVLADLRGPDAGRAFGAAKSLTSSANPCRRAVARTAANGYISAMVFPPFDPAPPPRRRRFKAIPVRTLLPNLITLLALCAGLTAIRLAVEGQLDLALGAIVFAALLDGIDGRLARMLKGTSRFGAELDSLADFVNFGVAPALILYFWGLHELKSAGWIAALVFAICAALRLARFNVMIDDPNKPAWAGNFFTGIPAPAGAITVLLPIYLDLPRRLRRPRRGLAHVLLHAGDRAADGVAAAGVLRQARRQARAARDGAAGLRRGGAVLRAADQLSVGSAHASARSPISPACRSAGCPIANISARMRASRRRCGDRCRSAVSAGHAAPSEPTTIARRG